METTDLQLPPMQGKPPFEFFRSLFDRFGDDEAALASATIEYLQQAFKADQVEEEIFSQYTMACHCEEPAVGLVWGVLVELQDLYAYEEDPDIDFRFEEASAWIKAETYPFCSKESCKSNAVAVAVDFVEYQRAKNEDAQDLHSDNSYGYKDADASAFIACSL